MGDHPNVARLRECYTIWHETKATSIDVWMDIMADDCSLFSLAAGQPNVEFTAKCDCKDAAAGYLNGLIEQWSMEFYRVDEFLQDGDKVVAIGATAWINKKTGKRAHTAKVDVWTFRGEEAVAFAEYYDTACLLNAAS